MKNAITKAIEGGWYPPNKIKGYSLRWVKLMSVTAGRAFISGHLDTGTNVPPPEMVNLPLAEITLDPAFWSSLGKAMWWDENQVVRSDNGWLNMWHRFIDKLASGG